LLKIGQKTRHKRKKKNTHAYGRKKRETGGDRENNRCRKGRG